MRLTRPVPVLLAAAALALSACGDDESEEHENVSPATALKEAQNTRAMITTGLAAYKAGDAKTAEDQVSEAYVSHFEHVEPVLEEKDAELTEELEDGIREELLDLIKDGKPAAEVEAKATEIFAGLDKAEAALR